MLIVKLVLLLVIANGTPIIVRNILGARWNRPIDGNTRLADGQPLFGPKKTIRGVLTSVIVTAGCASLLGLGWHTGFIVGLVAMLGDLLASFVKRRLKKQPSSMALGLDQIPESLFPMLACKNLLALTMLDVMIVVVSFFVVELLLSKILYKLHIRDKPY